MAKNSERPVIFFATRPIGPPWDEASKNLVYKMSGMLRGFSSVLLGYKNAPPLETGANVQVKKIYPRAEDRRVSPAQKLCFLVAFLFSRADVYHFYFTPELYSSFIFKIIKKFKPGKYLQTFATPIENPEKIPQLVFGDSIVVQSDHSLNQLRKQNVQPAPIRIYLGVDADSIFPAGDVSDLRQELQFGAKDKVVLYAGNYYLGCNDILAESILSLLKRRRDLRFIFACRISQPIDLERKQRLKTIFETNGIADRITFFDTAKNIHSLIALCDVHIFPATTMVGKADIPLVLLETLALEKPVIVSDVPPLNEIMKDDVGEIIPPGDAPGLVKAVETLLEDDTLRQAKGKRGRQMVVREFGLGNYAKQYEKIYQRLLGEKP